MTQRLFMAVALILALSVPGWAQTTTTQTALSAAVTNTTDTQFSLASATDFTASTNTATSFAYLGQELVQIRTVDTTNNRITVTRGRGGTASAHAVGTVITEGIVGSVDRATGNTAGVFLQQDPIGRCTAGNQGYTLVVNYLTHQYFRCNADTGEWDRANYRHDRANVTDAGNANYTATLLDRYVLYGEAGPSAGRTVTLPSITGLDGVQVTVKMHTTGATQTITVQGSNGQIIGPGSAVTNTEIGDNGEDLTFVSYNDRWWTKR